MGRRGSTIPPGKMTDGSGSHPGVYENIRDLTANSRIATINRDPK
jgi:hypothetical protein